MRYPIDTTAIIDVTKPPYCADNTGKTDCTEILRRILDDIMIRQVDALKATYDRLIELSNNKKENAYIGIEGGRVQNGQLSITFSEFEPSNKIIYFPNGTYLVSDTVTYTIDNLKGFWYWVPNFENCRNIHFLGESKENTVIRLADNSSGFEKGNTKPLLSFVNHELKLPRNKEFTNVAFMNTLEDITLDCGSGNPGAVGVKYVASNCGRIENVSIKTEDGYCGIYVANNTTQAVFSGIDISGFEHGIDAENTAMLTLDRLDVSKNKISGIYTGASTIYCGEIFSGNIPALKFKSNPTGGRYYLADPELSHTEETFGNNIFKENTRCGLRQSGIPKNKRSTNPDDWALVDDFGAIGDGKTDSTSAIQRAMNSGKPIIVFGEGEYLINAKIKIPKTVKTVDFLFCSLACGIRLVGGEYDSAFEINEDSDELLFIENLSAWENFRGHIRLVKQTARRDTVFSDIHLMSASLYFNTVAGSKLYFENCFLTTGTYTRDAWIPGDGFVPVYSHIIPLELHGQTLYGRVVNLERADMALLNDGSDILIDAYRTEGSGTALRSINGGVSRFNLFNAGIGCKWAENPLFELIDAKLELNEAIAFGFDTNSEYNVLITDKKGDLQNQLIWDDAESFSANGKYIKQYKNY